MRLLRNLPTRWILAAVLITASVSPLDAQFSNPVENELLIKGGWLFDGTGDERRPNTGIVVRNGKFVAVGLGALVALSETATVIEPDDFNQRLVELRKFHAAGGPDSAADHADWVLQLRPLRD